MKDIFCAKCQEVTPHKAQVDQNGEFVFMCQNVTKDASGNAVLDEAGNPVMCDRFIKFSADTTPETFPDTLRVHEESNVGQVSLEGQEKTLNALLEGSLPENAQTTPSTDATTSDTIDENVEGELPIK